MAFISFVSQNFLKTNSPINKNVDIDELLNHLEYCELINTREVTGKLLYDDLKSKFLNQTLSAIEIELVELIKQQITYRASSASLPFLNYKISAKGVQTLNGENSQPVDTKSIQLLQNTLDNRAEYFEQRMADFLCLNAKDFPLYLQADTKTGIYVTKMDKFDSDVYIDTDYKLRVNRYLYGPNNPL